MPHKRYRMTLTFEALEPDYKQHLARVELLKVSAAKAVVNQIFLPHKDRFLAVQQRTGVPALWLMPTWYREEPRFDCYFGNGDPLDRITTDVPRGRGPFATWEEGCVDSLALDHISQPATWTWEYACYEWERWNGFGPRNHGRPTGYLWAGTSEYRGGKYVEDGVWSPRTWDTQLGTVIIARELATANQEIGKG